MGKHKGLGYDINYGVPNFGVDRDIIDSMNNLGSTELQLGHKFGVGSAESKKKYHNVAKDTLYNFAPEYDSDIISTQKNLNDAEIRQ